MNSSEIVEQGSEAWRMAKLGKVSASRISDVMARNKSGWGASRTNYMAELVCERLTGVPYESYSNGIMKRGNEFEDEARAAYEFLYSVEIAKVGFVLHPTIAEAGSSPDRFVGEEGLIEIKCPNTATHIDTLMGANIPGDYMKQMQFQMACTGRKWCDFVSYDPRLPQKLRLHVARVPRDNGMISEIEMCVSDFLKEMFVKLQQVQQLER
jgi:predicted phage-related endonuclease